MPGVLRWLALAVLLLLALLGAGGRAVQAQQQPMLGYVRSRGSSESSAVATKASEQNRLLEKRLGEALTGQAELRRQREALQRRMLKQQRSTATQIDRRLQRQLESSKLPVARAAALRLQKLYRLAHSQATANTPRHTDSSYDPFQLRLSSKEFRKLVLEAPRPYWLLVSLTSLDSAEHRCPLCQMAHNSTLAVGPGFYELNERLLPAAQQTTDGLQAFVRHAMNSRDLTSLPLWPVQMTIRDHRPLMIDLQLQSLPQLLLLPPKLSPGAVRAENFIEKLPTRYNMPPSAAMSSEALLEWLSRLTGKDLQVVAPQSNSLQRLVRELQERSTLEQAGAALAVALALGVVYLAVARLWAPVRRQRRLFLLAGWLIYVGGVSGFMFNVLKDTPWWAEPRAVPASEDAWGWVRLLRQFMLAGAVSPLVVAENRMQARAESLVYAVLLSVSAGGLLLLAGLARGRAPRGPVGRLVKLSSGVLGVLLLGAVVACWYQTLVVYTHKMGIYRMGWVQDAEPLWMLLRARLGPPLLRLWRPLASLLQGLPMPWVQGFCVGLGLLLLTFF